MYIYFKKKFIYFLPELNPLVLLAMLFDFGLLGETRLSSSLILREFIFSKSSTTKNLRKIIYELYVLV